MASIFMPNGAFFSRNTPTPRALCLLLAELVKNNVASLIYIAVGVAFLRYVYGFVVKESLRVEFRCPRATVVLIL